MIDKPVIYVFLNKELHMSVGKAAAQAAHAAVRTATGSISSELRLKQWVEAAHRYIIVLEARDSNHMTNIQTYLNDRGICTKLIIDEGANETEPHVMTALATQILDKDAPHIQQTFSTFHTYHDDIKVTLEIPR